MNKMLTINEVARIFNVHPATVKQWYRQGRIRQGNPGALEAPLFRREDVIVSYINSAIRRSSRH